MNKLLVAILMVLTVLGGPAFAGSSRAGSGQGYSSGIINTPGAGQLLDTRGAVIYNMTVNGVGAGNGILTIYDTNATTTGTYSPSEILYEVEVASANDSRSVDMNAAPLMTYNGVVATCNNCYGFLNMEK